MTAARRIVVVGANAAGMSAAHQALRTAAARGREIEVIAVESTHDTSYAACALPYWIAGDTATAADFTARTAVEHRARGVDLRLGVAAVALDLDGGRLRVRADDGAESALGFDDVVLATGAIAVVPPWARRADGGLVAGVHPVKTLDDGRHWIERLSAPSPAGRPRRAVIVGGGYIGVELAEALLRRGLAVELVTRHRVLASLDPDMSQRVEERLRAGGVGLRVETEVAGLEVGGSGVVSGVVTDDGATVPADVVVLGVGVEPNSGLGSAGGISVGKHGGHLPDPGGRVGAGAWAVGDCCETVHRLTGERVYLPLGTHANKMGRAAGQNLGGGRAAFGGVLGTSITRFEAGAASVEVARTGLSTRQAERAGRAAASLVTEGTTASGYMPEAAPIATAVVADRDTRQLLGVQIVGGPNAAKRVDAAAAALWGGLGVDDLAAMDLAYAPPFATAWEAVQVAARRLADRL